MAIPTSANYVFLPWVRQGAASGIQTPDSLSANQAGVVSVPVKLRVNNTDDIDRQVRLYGPAMSPASIRSRWCARSRAIWPRISSRTTFRRLNLIARTFPGSSRRRRLMPPASCVRGSAWWSCANRTASLCAPTAICRCRCSKSKRPPGPSMSCRICRSRGRGRTRRLPAARRDAGSLKQSLAGDPALTVSRLLCPRRLDPLTDYLACVVPAFELGRKAGLGFPIQPDDEKAVETGVDDGSAISFPGDVAGLFSMGVSHRHRR